MSFGRSPASAIAFSAASACNWICDMSGMTPSRVVSAAPTLVRAALQSSFSREELCLSFRPPRDSSFCPGARHASKPAKRLHYGKHKNPGGKVGDKADEAGLYGPIEQ